MNSQLSITHLIFNAHIFVQLIMLLLVAGTIYALYTLFKKNQQLKRLEALYEHFYPQFAHSKDLPALYQHYNASNTPIEGVLRLFMMGMREFTHFTASSMSHTTDLVALSCQRTMENTLFEEEENIQKDLHHLATVASASPYIGLLGTVYGIMNSFIAIGKSANTSIANVAPGIAEALIATGIGLLSAISALLAYNYLNGRADKLMSKYESFIANFSNILVHQTLRIKDQARVKS